jgi:predicted Zn-dependent protease
MDRSQAESIIQKTLSLSDADETEVILSSGTENLTRFSDNVITQNVSRSADGLSIRLHMGKKIGRATTDRFEQDALKRAVDRAKDAASQQDDNPEILPMLGPSEYQDIEAFHQKTADFTPAQRAEGIKRIAAAAEKVKGNSAGIYSTGGDAVALGNSHGLFAYYRSTNATFSVTVDINDNSGWAEETHRDVTRINADRVSEIAIQKAMDAQDPITLDPGEYPVVLEPAAVSDFLMFMAYEGLGGVNFNENRSFMSGKLGQKIMGENITIIDDAYSPLNPGLPFDFEGQPRQQVTLIEKGVAKSVVHDRRTAGKANTESSGHALPQPSSTGPIPLNIILAPGDSSLEEMIQSTDRGILVTHFHYTNVLDPIVLSLTGMTRDGTYLIENGKVTRPIKNMRFTQGTIEAFNHVELISKEQITAAAFFEGSFVVPALKISKFNFSSGSEF